MRRIKQKGSLEISQILYNRHIKKDHYPINKIENNIENFYSLLSPTECEDLLYFYLYDKYRYVAIPSTNKIETQNYEFVMLSPDNRDEKIYIQVKNGYSKKTDLYLENFYELDGIVYLLTTGGKIYDKENKIIKISFKDSGFQIIGSTEKNKKIYAINPEALYEFAKESYKNKNKNILISQSILQWFEYLK